MNQLIKSRQYIIPHTHARTYKYLQIEFAK